jgi:hypothetical protein
LKLRSFQDHLVWVSILLRKNYVKGQICVKFQNVILTVCFCPNIFVYIIIGLFRSQVIFFAIIHFCFIHVFVSSIICTNLHGYSRNRNRSFVLLCFQYIYWFLSLKIIIGLHYKGYWVWFVDFIFLNSKKKKNKLWGKRCSKHIRVENLDFCVKHERCEDIFYATNQILHIQRMSENNESVTQNSNVALHLRAIGQQLELLYRTYKDLKDEVNSIKQ